MNWISARPAPQILSMKDDTLSAVVLIVKISISHIILKISFI